MLNVIKKDLTLPKDLFANSIMKPEVEVQNERFRLFRYDQLFRIWLRPKLNLAT